MIVADTSPLCYLILIQQVDVLPQLYEQILIPSAVAQELAASESPEQVQRWIKQPPQWLDIRPSQLSTDPMLQKLDLGEREAIALAELSGADLLLIDEKMGRTIARDRGLNVTGLLGVLGNSASKGLVNFPDVIARLQQTSFYVSPKLIAALLQRYQ